ncbi:rho gtpase-activating protein [Anaeramoeba flamelloides]|uniref:Rho gtpase-activating protein n=1 Tax=Anaeramoeba flamelloides TaxID=1746091 RepID=A0AAV7Z7W9_9EUKA|nr:rho gtpase-activating protein [Anaeramoeba flamelloides]
MSINENKQASKKKEQFLNQKKKGTKRLKALFEYFNLAEMKKEDEKKFFLANSSKIYSLLIDSIYGFQRGIGTTKKRRPPKTTEWPFLFALLRKLLLYCKDLFQKKWQYRSFTGLLEFLCSLEQKGSIRKSGIELLLSFVDILTDSSDEQLPQILESSICFDVFVDQFKSQNIKFRNLPNKLPIEGVNKKDKTVDSVEERSWAFHKLVNFVLHKTTEKAFWMETMKKSFFTTLYPIISEKISLIEKNGNKTKNKIKNENEKESENESENENQNENENKNENEKEKEKEKENETETETETETGFREYCPHPIHLEVFNLIISCFDDEEYSTIIHQDKDLLSIILEIFSQTFHLPSNYDDLKALILHVFENWFKPNVEQDESIIPNKSSFEKNLPYKHFQYRAKWVKSNAIIFWKKFFELFGPCNSIKNSKVHSLCISSYIEILNLLREIENLINNKQLKYRKLPELYLFSKIFFQSCLKRDLYYSGRSLAYGGICILFTRNFPKGIPTQLLSNLYYILTHGLSINDHTITLMIFRFSSRIFGYSLPGSVSLINPYLKNLSIFLNPVYESKTSNNLTLYAITILSSMFCFPEQFENNYIYDCKAVMTQKFKNFQLFGEVQELMNLKVKEDEEIIKKNMNNNIANKKENENENENEKENEKGKGIDIKIERGNEDENENKTENAYENENEKDNIKQRKKLIQVMLEKNKNDLLYFQKEKKIKAIKSFLIEQKQIRNSMSEINYLFLNLQNHESDIDYSKITLTKKNFIQKNLIKSRSIFKSNSFITNIFSAQVIICVIWNFTSLCISEINLTSPQLLIIKRGIDSILLHTFSLNPKISEAATNSIICFSHYSQIINRLDPFLFLNIIFKLSEVISSKLDALKIQTEEIYLQENNKKKIDKQLNIEIPRYVFHILNCILNILMYNPHLIENKKLNPLLFSTISKIINIEKRNNNCNFNPFFSEEGVNNEESKFKKLIRSRTRSGSVSNKERKPSIEIAKKEEINKLTSQSLQDFKKSKKKNNENNDYYNLCRGEIILLYLLEQWNLFPWEDGPEIFNSMINQLDDLPSEIILEKFNQINNNNNDDDHGNSQKGIGDNLLVVDKNINKKRFKNKKRSISMGSINQINKIIQRKGVSSKENKLKYQQKYFKNLSRAKTEIRPIKFEKYSQLFVYKNSIILIYQLPRLKLKKMIVRIILRNLTGKYVWDAEFMNNFQNQLITNNFQKNINNSKYKENEILKNNINEIEKENLKTGNENKIENKNGYQRIHGQIPQYQQGTEINGIDMLEELICYINEKNNLIENEIKKKQIKSKSSSNININQEHNNNNNNNNYNYNTDDVDEKNDNNGDEAETEVKREKEIKEDKNEKIVSELKNEKILKNKQEKKKNKFGFHISPKKKVKKNTNKNNHKASLLSHEEIQIKKKQEIEHLQKRNLLIDRIKNSVVKQQLVFENSPVFRNDLKSSLNCLDKIPNRFLNLPELNSTLNLTKELDQQQNKNNVLKSTNEKDEKDDDDDNDNDNDITKKKNWIMPKKSKENLHFQHFSRMLLSQLGFLSMSEQKKLIPLKKTSNLENDLYKLDLQSNRDLINVSIIYIPKKRQSKEEILSNNYESNLFKQFVKGLGWQIDITQNNNYYQTIKNPKNIQKNSPNNRSIFLPYFSNFNIELLFHIITRLPNNNVGGENKNDKSKGRNEEMKDDEVGDDDDEEDEDDRKIDSSDFLTREQIIKRNKILIFWSENEDTCPIKQILDFKPSVCFGIYQLKNGMFRMTTSDENEQQINGPIIDGMILSQKILPLIMREAIFVFDSTSKSEVFGLDHPFSKRNVLLQKIKEKYSRTLPFQDLMKQITIGEEASNQTFKNFEVTMKILKSREM